MGEESVTELLEESVSKHQNSTVQNDKNHKVPAWALEDVMHSFTPKDARWHLEYCPDCGESLLFDTEGRLTADCSGILCQGCHSYILLSDYGYFTNRNMIAENMKAMEKHLLSDGLSAFTNDGFFYHATLSKTWQEDMTNHPNLMFHAGSLMVSTALFAQRQEDEPIDLYRISVKNDSLYIPKIFDDECNDWAVNQGDFQGGEMIRGTIVYQNLWEICGEPSILTSARYTNKIEKIATIFPKYIPGDYDED